MMKVHEGFILDPSLVLYLPLHELAGVSFASKDAYGHLCTVTGALWRPNGRYFDGTDDKATINGVAAFEVNTGSIDLWCKGGEAGQAEHRVLAIYQGSTNKVELTIWTANRFYFSVWKTTEVCNLSKTITLTDWHHVGMTWSSTEAQLIVDGVAVTPAFGDERASLTTPEVQIGHLSNSYFWKGYIGEARVYNRALTPLEVQHIYLATRWRYQ